MQEPAYEPKTASTVLNDSSDVHFMQTDEWANPKSSLSWKLLRPELLNTKRVVYSRIIPGYGRLAYMPGVTGITMDNAGSFTRELKNELKGKKYFGAKLELYQLEDDALVDKLSRAGWVKAKKHIQYRHTVVADLRPSEEEIFMSLKKRARNEIRRAQQLNVQVKEIEPTDDNLESMYGLMTTTSERNNFYIRDREFTFNYWRSMRAANKLRLFFTYHGTEVLAGAVVLTSGSTAWYKDGGSIRHREKFNGPRLQQWEIIRQLKETGIKFYDLSGIPDERNYKSSSMPGIFVFKTGFAKEITRLMPTLELPLSRRFKLWHKIEPQWLRIYNLFARQLWY